MIVNRWREFVSDQTISLLSRWVEHYITSMMHSTATMPTEGHRYIFHKALNKLEQVIYKIEVLEGLEFSHSTAPKKFTELDEFTFAFRTLDNIEQLAILVYIDPFDELKDERRWSGFLRFNKIKSNAEYDRLLTKSMIRLQRICEKKGLSRIMRQEIRGWDRIAKRLNMSMLTAQKLAKDPSTQMPITLVGRVPVTTEEKISQWLDNRIEKKPYWLLAQEKIRESNEDA